VLIAVAAIAAAALPLSASAAGASGGLQLTEAGNTTFPTKSFVLTLPTSRLLTAGQVNVTENGNGVAGLSVVPASHAGKKTFGAVLVVDASDSMKGTPLEQAVAAEQAFVVHRNPNQQVGLIVFNQNPTVLLPLTSSPVKLNQALASTPPTARGTHIYDAVARAEAMLKNAGVSSGTIVVLSDGADTGSTTSAETVAKAAHTGHIQIYTVGLKSPTFKPHTLESLAAAGGGQYALAKTTSDLTPLFDQLGRLISNQYLVDYKSLAGPSVPIRVLVQVPGSGTASAAYKTPALSVPAPPPPYSPSLWDRITGSWITMVIIALLAAAVVCLLVWGLFQPRRSDLPERMSEFVSVPGLQSQARRPGGASAAEATTEDQSGEGPSPGLFARLDETLEIAQINTTAVRLVTATAVATIAAFALLWLAFSAWWALLALLIPFGVRSWVRWKLERRRKEFAEQLPDMLQVISAALRGGQSFSGALAVVVESAGEPMKSEMQRVVADEQRGIPLSVAMAVVVKRMDNRDLEQVALVAELQRESGGNAAEVVDRVADTVRGRFELRRLIDTLTVQGRMSRWIVTALPIALVIIISLINPHYMHPLVHRLIGKVMIVLAVLLVIGGSLVIKKIVDIKV
jgi:tight adherence protein B